MKCFWRVVLLGVCFLFSQGKVFAEAVAINVDPETTLGQLVADRELTFYAIDVSTGQDYAYNLPRSRIRYTPFSTFKIPHLLIALETGAVDSLQEEKNWDSTRHPARDFWPASWQRSHTLASAFQHSVPWYFKELTGDITADQYRTWLQQFAYGNGLAPAGSDDFWLEGPLAVSAVEQARFIARLTAGELGVSVGALEALKSVSLLEQGEDYRWYGKTGAGPVAADNMDGAFAGWLVGWVETAGGKTVSYALYTEGENFAAIKDYRREATQAFLQALQILP